MLLGVETVNMQRVYAGYNIAESSRLVLVQERDRFVYGWFPLFPCPVLQHEAMILIITIRTKDMICSRSFTYPSSLKSHSGRDDLLTYIRIQVHQGTVEHARQVNSHVH